MSTPSNSSPDRKPGRRILWNAAGLAIALAAIVVALYLWSGTRQFQGMVRTRLASQLQSMTGGRVEIGSFQWRLFSLQIDAGNIVIHGDEPAGEAPYARIERLRASFSVLGVFSPRILLRDLEIARPQMHIIFYPDGQTNQPHPAPRRTAGRSGIQTLFGLQAGHVAVAKGLMDLDNRAASLDFQHRYQPLNFRGDDVSLVMKYVPAAGRNPESYHAELGIADLSLVRAGTLTGKLPPVHALVTAAIDLTRDAAFIRRMRVTAHQRGAHDRTLEIAGQLVHFAEPQWQANLKGELDLRLIDPVFGYPFAPEGLAHLDLTAAGQGGQFRVDGVVHAQNAAYVGTGVVARGIDLTARVHADPTWLRITSIAARLRQGGEIHGDVLLEHWLPPASQRVVLVPAPDVQQEQRPSLGARLRRRFHLRSAPVPRPVPPQHSTLVEAVPANIPVEGTVNAQFHDVALDTVLDIVSQPPFQRLGIATLINGSANAVWHKGDVDTLTVDARLAMNASPRPAPGEVPGNGLIDATYTQRDGGVQVRAFDVNLPGSRLQAHGHLGAYPLTSATALTVDFKSTNLGEFDTVLRSLGLQRHGRTGVSALPVALHGQGEFHGTWSGSLTSPRLAGTALATNIEIELPPMGKSMAPRMVQLDRVEADGAYDAEHIAIVHGQLQHGAAHLSVDGTLAAVPRLQPSRTPRSQAQAAAPRGDELPAFDQRSVLRMHAQGSQLDTADLISLAGIDLPVTGKLDAQISVDGPINAIRGSGTAQLNHAVIAGEPVSRVRAQGGFADKTLTFSSFSASAPAGTISGAGAYEIQSGGFQAHATTQGLDLAAIQRLRTAGLDLAGHANLAASVSGTRQDPHLDIRGSVDGLAFRGEPFGNLTLTARTVKRALHYDLGTHLESAALVIHGQTELHDDYATQARLEFSQFDIGSIFRLDNLGAISASSALAGVATVSGPLAHPAELRGDLRIPQMALTIAGVHLQSNGPVHAALANELITLDAVHVTGDQTNLYAQGTFGITGSHPVNFAASGSVNLKLAQTLDPDVTAGGVSTFQVEAHGPLANPALRGTVEFQNGSLALEDIPNGLSQINGRLRFNQNRLEVESLTAMTGGGQLRFAGYLTYQHGVYADLSVTGKSIRIRYPEGVSSLADATLHAQGTPASLLFSGNILITRFSVNPDLDIAALAAQATAVQPVAPPNAPSNHVRLDVRIQSSPQLNFQNAYAKLAGDVDLHLRGTLAMPSLLGRISITEGSAVIAGTRYELQGGDVTFTNPVRIQPNIDLNATARVEDYDITLGLHGTPDKMSVTYRSDPPLPEADVVALLALGRTQSEQGLYTQQQQQSIGSANSTDVLLGGALNATVSSRVQKLFGAGSVKVDPSYLGALGNSTTRITVEEQLGKNVTLTYATNVDTSAQQLLQAEIAVNRHVAVLVTRDESGVFSMVIKAVRRYR